MTGWLPQFNEMVFFDFIKSVVLFVGLFVIRAIVLRIVFRQLDLSVEAKRLWVLNLRRAVLIVFTIGLIFIWAHELSTLAVSLLAVAVALVLATKELILCMTGSALRLGAGTYSIGDRIAIGGFRGVVIDGNMLATTLMEIGPGSTLQHYTGNAVVFPNSMLFTNPLVNETYMKEYVVHVIQVPMALSENWQRAEQVLLDAAKEECAPFLEDAGQYMKELEGKEWLDTPSVAPRVMVQLPEPGRINLLLRVPSPAKKTARVEQGILRRFLASFPAAQSNTAIGPTGKELNPSGKTS